MSLSFPKKSVLWTGAILGGIVHATVTALRPSLASSRQWVRNHYVVDGGDGREGVVVFAGGNWYADAPLVGMFGDFNRGPSQGQEVWEKAFRGCPEYQRSLAEQGSLPWHELEVYEKLRHGVTATFWDEGETLASAEPWEVVLANGVGLVSTELIEDYETALGRWQREYLMSQEEVALARSLFERKTARPAPWVDLTPAEIHWLEERAANVERLTTSRKLFAELGIDLPDRKGK